MLHKLFVVYDEYNVPTMPSSHYGKIIRRTMLEQQM